MTSEDAIKYVKEVTGMSLDWNDEHYGALQMAIEALQTEIVRCKDCKHRREICPMRYIEMVGEDERIHDYSADNGYCSWGERKGGDSE